MGKTIIFGNLKGGVAKTTSTLNISTQLAQRGYNVLMIDSDPQASLTIISGFEPDDFIDQNLITLLYDDEGSVDVHDCIHKVETFESENGGSLSLIPSEIELANGEMDFVSRKGNDRLIRRIVNKVIDEYDYICIDCPPSLGVISVNDIAASDYIIGCVEPGLQALRGIRYYLRSILNSIKACDYNTKFLGLIIAKVANNADVRDVVEAFKEDYEVLGEIKSSVEVSRGEIDGISISQRKPSHIASLEYSSITDTILDKINKGV